MDILFFNADILLDDGSIRKNAELGADGAFITHIADSGTADKGVKERIDCRGGLLTPAFYNTHTHSPMTLLRGYGENLPLMRWLNERIFPAEARMTADDAYYGTLLACMEMLRGGTASATDMYFFTESVARAFDECGMKANVSPVLTCAPDADPAAPGFYSSLAGLCDRYGTHERIKVDMSIHAEYSTTEKSVRIAAGYAAENGLRIHLHLSETASEHSECIARHGKTPAGYFYDCGVFEVPVNAAHCVHCTDGDFALMAEKKATAACCPASNFKLASGLINARAMYDAGVNIALGTDGAASNNSLSMPETMKLFSLSAKYGAGDAAFLTPKEIFSAATANGARAQGRMDCGFIKEGMRADLVLWDTGAPPLIPCYDALTGLVYSADAGLVVMTVVDGKVLYRDGEYRTIDRERVLFETNERKF